MSAQLHPLDLSRKFLRAQKYGRIFCFTWAISSPQVSHKFCGQDCEQGPAHDSKLLIFRKKFIELKFVAAWLAERFPPKPRLSHNFCGKDCEQGH
ncbi:hypothetical protein NX774_11715 [Massilia agilis]|uniref:Uncharacterized protein n=1 Tax=Massilia agilis TaxID=1811226 RepID=A0ABT2DB84_9BURK|nr:hypothetical protein [Massilia agilis]MCS0808587.1 hypothetical protein [Massilia agilis]